MESWKLDISLLINGVIFIIEIKWNSNCIVGKGEIIKESRKEI